MGKNLIGESELEQTAGGHGFYKCNFVHKSGVTTVKLRADGQYEAECGSYCYGCGCHGDNTPCYNNMHIVTVNGSPLPREDHQNWYA